MLFFCFYIFSQRAQSQPRYVVLKILVKIKEFAFPRFGLVKKAFLVNVHLDLLESYVMCQLGAAVITFEETSQSLQDYIKFS